MKYSQQQQPPSGADSEDFEILGYDRLFLLPTLGRNMAEHPCRDSIGSWLVRYAEGLWRLPPGTRRN